MQLHENMLYLYVPLKNYYEMLSEKLTYQIIYIYTHTYNVYNIYF